MTPALLGCLAAVWLRYSSTSLACCADGGDVLGLLLIKSTKSLGSRALGLTPSRPSRVRKRGDCAFGPPTSPGAAARARVSVSSSTMALRSFGCGQLKFLRGLCGRQGHGTRLWRGIPGDGLEGGGDVSMDPWEGSSSAGCWATSFTVCLALEGACCCRAHIGAVSDSCGTPTFSLRVPDGAAVQEAGSLSSDADGGGVLICNLAGVG